MHSARWHVLKTLQDSAPKHASALSPAVLCHKDKPITSKDTAGWSLLRFLSLLPPGVRLHPT